ncbi:hypothetical protein GZH47_24935 [Paenibacillus rhizovicinus]|uniref:YhfM-like domain-containing protein n=1 Tax=Paenibacillus rhizovicinus TaxID=2704463 RepID=A0A6C0P5U0_9BACL|nr:hypothetical protein [Paenibacillus rhizovicinus]QHW33721.1 hypothetical protein GZH47_24935 [Paenibacillus rhizovicinus]
MLKPAFIGVLLVITLALALATSCGSEPPKSQSAMADAAQNKAVGEQTPTTLAYDNVQVQIITMKDLTEAASRTVTDTETVAVIMNALSAIDWENAKVSMSRPPDYKMLTQNTDPLASYEPQLYEVWISPQKDHLEFVQGAEGKYGRMPAAESAKLIAILQSN